MHQQPATRKYWYLVGAGLTTAGSLLPWEVGGDFIPYWQPGIAIRRTDLAGWLRGVYDMPRVDDHGGLLVVLLTLIFVLLVYGKFHFVRTPLRWAVVCAVGLVFLSLYHASDVLRRRLESGGIFGAPEPAVGLMVVMVGSLILLYVSASAYRRQSSSRDTAPPQ
jgi:hypothetical protein